jgi:putative transposase
MKRRWVRWVQGAYQVSERRACELTGVARSTIRYRSRRPRQEPLRRRLKELATVRIGYGYRRLHVLLRREGWPINHKRVYRLYRDEGLALKRKRPKRRRSAVARRRSQVAHGPNERWAMDFMHDTLAGGEKMRVLTVIDVFTRECLALVAKKHFRGEDVAQTLTRLLGERGRPKTIQCDQGTEFTSLAMDHWAYWNQVRLDFSRPGKPGDNARNEAFNGTVRRECLTQHYFLTLEEAQRVLDQWRAQYNNDRPHGSLNQLPPVQYKAGWRKAEDLSRLANSSY